MSMKTGRPVRAVLIGASAGGLEALMKILPPLGGDLPVPILVVQHMSPDADDFMVQHLDKLCGAFVKEAEDKEWLEPGTVYVGPPGYHFMVDDDHAVALSVDERVKFSRPSIDVLFETAAEAYAGRVIGVVLTGANDDGAQGLAAIKSLGGLTVVQDPSTAIADAMPLAALEAVDVDHVVPLDNMGVFLRKLILEAADV